MKINNPTIPKFPIIVNNEDEIFKEMDKLNQLGWSCTMKYLPKLDDIDLYPITITEYIPNSKKYYINFKNLF